MKYKIYFKIVSVIVLIGTYVGFILPTLISSKSDELVLIGIGLTPLLFIPIVFLIINSILKDLKIK